MNSLKAESITVEYNSKLILDSVSFSLNQGEFACLLGPNGAGKTTLLSAVSGTLQGMRAKSVTRGTGIKGTDLSGGTVLIETTSGQTDYLKLPQKKKAGLIGYLQQGEQSVWNFTVKDYVLQGRFIHSHGGHYQKNDYDTVNSVLQELEMISFAERKVHTLSGGEFQKVRIARTLAQEPSFLLLDEPAGNLDYVYEPQLMIFLKQLARKKNIGILITIHDINLAWRFADKIMLLSKEKKLISGLADDIMTVENLKTTFGVDFQCKETKLFQSLQ